MKDIRRQLIILSAKNSARVAGIVIFVYVVHGGAEVIRGYFNATVAEATSVIDRQLTKTVVVRELMAPDKVSVDEIIIALSNDAGLNPIIVRALAVEESGKLMRTDRIRYEAKLMARINPPRSLNEIERQLWASSIGVTQVIYGLHYKLCDLRSPTELFDPRTSVSCTIKILKANLAASSNIKKPGRRLREAFRMYNGSGPMAEQYADRLMTRVEDMMDLNLGSGI